MDRFRDADRVFARHAQYHDWPVCVVMCAGMSTALALLHKTLYGLALSRPVHAGHAGKVSCLECQGYRTC